MVGLIVAFHVYIDTIWSLVCVLTYITVAKIEDKDCTIQQSLPCERLNNAWFKDEYQSDREAHFVLKRLFYLNYGYTPQQVSIRYYCYLNIILPTEKSAPELTADKPEPDDPTRWGSS